MHASAMMAANYSLSKGTISPPAAKEQKIATASTKL
jgi:hypothetical protein